jgi:hypothetical protein
MIENNPNTSPSSANITIPNNKNLWNKVKSCSCNVIGVIVYTITYTALMPQAKTFNNAGQSGIVPLHTAHRDHIIEGMQCLLMVKHWDWKVQVSLRVWMSTFL